MRSFLSLFRFELRYQVFGPTFIVSFFAFFLLAFFGTASERVQIGGPSSVNLNAPSAIALTIGILSIFALFIPTAMLSNGVIRDREYKTEELFYATPVKPHTLVLGRFWGGTVATWLAFASVPIAMFLASLMPWIDPERLGPFRPTDFMYLFFVVGALNMLVSGLILFTVANLTRSVFATYIALTAFLVLYFTGNALLDRPEYRTIAAISDPLALNAIQEVMRYWTPDQRNTEMLPLAGTLLYNRILWSGIALVLLAVNVFTFTFRRPSRLPKKTKKDKADEDGAAPPVQVGLVRHSPESNASFAQLLTRIRFESLAVVRSPAFWILLVLGIVNTVASLLLGLDVMYGTPSYPMTRVMLQTVVGAFGIIPVIVAVYYASELVWRERSVGISEVIDATPTPSWVFVVSKFVALSLVVVCLFLVAISSAIIVQLAKGHPDLELDQYALRFFVDLTIPFTLLAVLCLFMQVVTNNRWIGILAIVLYIVASMVAGSFGYDHRLFIYGEAPPMPYSDMNRYGHFLSMGLWFYLYWSFWALILITLSYQLWNRGALRPISQRLGTLARASAASKALLAFGLAGVIGTGAWVYYNTNVRNPYLNTVRLEERSLAFEDKYREKYENIIQPKITAVDLAVDIFPEERRSVFKGTLRLVNRTEKPIDELLIDYDYGATVVSLTIEGSEVVEVDDVHNVHRLKLTPPLAVGEAKTLAFETVRQNPGFKNSGNISKANFNGTFLNGGDGLPFIGFNASKMLQPRNVRRRYDREPLPRMPDLDDKRFFNVNVLRTDSDWVDFAVTVSTSEDQVAIAPGYLEKEWREGGRRYFRYAMDRPIMNFFSFQSAAYEVMSDKWKDVDLQVYYHPDHKFNVDRMMKAMKKSFDYFTANFSPYQYRQMRILEFPAYSSFAQSFANTVPFSESIGYVLDLRDEEKLDMVFYVTAHEVAHQWWGHQVVPSLNQGATMLVETFAQYGALMTMEKEYGEHAMRRFLKYELDRYLRGRANEPEAEKPLYRVENQQYIHYRKGSVVMYALKDYVGEDVVNRSLARLIKETGGRIDPYPRTTDYLRILREEAGPDHDTLITDLFEKIVLYDIRVTDAKVDRRDDGRFDVTIKYSAQKIESDEKGKETDVPLDLEIDVGIFSKDLEDVYKGQDHVIFFEKKRVTSGDAELKITVDREPVMVGVDPYNKLIDRVSNDNLRRVTVPGES